LFLNLYHEFVGDVVEVKIEEGKIKILFAINREIEVPQTAFSEDELKNLAGRIGIINYGDGYKLRKIK